jgi:large subunit ribosomal protein L28
VAASAIRTFDGSGRCRDPGILEVCVKAAVCEVCGKRPQFGMKLSHSHRRSKRRWNPNVQRIRAIVNGSPRRVNACTSCIKAGKVQKP